MNGEEKEKNEGATNVIIRHELVSSQRRFVLQQHPNGEAMSVCTCEHQWRAAIVVEGVDGRSALE
jgi:hypothetical protein